MNCRILLLIFLAPCVSGSFVVNVTQTSYQAEENLNITLEWNFTYKPDSPPKYLFILCQQTDNGSVLYYLQDGTEVSDIQDEKFSGRVQSNRDTLREGRITLQLLRLRTDDSGQYMCTVNTDYGFSSANCQLNVSGAPDQHQPTLNPKRWNQNLFLLSLIIPVIHLMFILCWFVLRKKKERTNLYTAEKMLSFLDKDITGTNGTLSAGPTLDQSESLELENHKTLPLTTVLITRRDL